MTLPPADIQAMLNAIDWIEGFEIEFSRKEIIDDVDVWIYKTNDGCELFAWYTEDGPYWEL